MISEIQNFFELPLTLTSLRVKLLTIKRGNIRDFTKSLHIMIFLELYFVYIKTHKKIPKML